MYPADTPGSLSLSVPAFCLFVLLALIQSKDLPVSACFSQQNRKQNNIVSSSFLSLAVCYKTRTAFSPYKRRKQEIMCHIQTVDTFVLYHQPHLSHQTASSPARNPNSAPQPLTRLNHPIRLASWPQARRYLLLRRDPALRQPLRCHAQRGRGRIARIRGRSIRHIGIPVCRCWGRSSSSSAAH